MLKDLGMEPERILYEGSRNCKLNILPMDSGIGPSSLLLPNISILKSFKPPTSPGILPVNWFVDRPINVAAFKFPISGGKEPLKKLEIRFSHKRSLSFHKLVGMVEVNLLEPRRSCLKAVILLRHSGILPDKWFRCKSRIESCFKLQRLRVMDPSNLFPARYNAWSPCIFSSVHGMTPVKSLLGKFSITKLRKFPTSLGSWNAALLFTIWCTKASKRTRKMDYRNWEDAIQSSQQHLLYISTICQGSYKTHPGIWRFSGEIIFKQD